MALKQPQSATLDSDIFMRVLLSELRRLPPERLEALRATRRASIVAENEAIQLARERQRASRDRSLAPGASPDEARGLTVALPGSQPAAGRWTTARRSVERFVHGDARVRERAADE